MGRGQQLRVEGCHGQHLPILVGSETSDDTHLVPEVAYLRLQSVVDM